jgi:hypothetical protein
MPTGPPWNSAAMITTPVGYSAITRRNPAAGSCSVEAILGGPRLPTIAPVRWRFLPVLPPAI